LNSIINYTDDATVVGLINSDDDSANTEEVQNIESWFIENVR